MSGVVPVSSSANVTCPKEDCHGEFEETSTPDVYECRRCGRKLRQAVVERIGAFKREAGRDSRLSEIADAALEGIDG